MRTRLLTALAPAFIALLPLFLSAQRLYPEPQHHCAAYDSLMAGARKDRLGSATVSREHGGRRIHVVGAMVVSDRDRGIIGVGGTIRGDSGVGIDSASVQLNVVVVVQTRAPVPPLAAVYR
jgi:hypothetical protein